MVVDIKTEEVRNSNRVCLCIVSEILNVIKVQQLLELMVSVSAFVYTTFEKDNRKWFVSSM